MLELSLQSNDLYESVENMRNLRDCLSKLYNLQYLVLGLSYNWLAE